MENAVFFCTVTGVRLVAPGVSKSVDPVNGVAEFNESTPEAPKPAGKSAKKDQE
ncbi:MAG TPA: hypothetical protein VGK73_25275 [Polyangiaceae bacterium]